MADPTNENPGAIPPEDVSAGETQDSMPAETPADIVPAGGGATDSTPAVPHAAQTMPRLTRYRRQM